MQIVERNGQNVVNSILHIIIGENYVGHIYKCESNGYYLEVLDKYHSDSEVIESSVVPEFEEAENVILAVIRDLEEQDDEY